MISLFIRRISGIALLVCSLAGTSHAATIGNTFDGRGKTDGFNDFIIIASDPFAVSGRLTSWEIAVNEAGSDGRIGLVIANNPSNGVFSIDAIEIQQVSVGKNTFTSNFDVKEGQRLGFFMTDSKVGYSAGGVKTFATGNNPYAGADPKAGDAITIAYANLTRTYAFSAFIDTTRQEQLVGAPAVSAVPLPATLPLLMGAFGGLAFLRRKYKK